MMQKRNNLGKDHTGGKAIRREVIMGVGEAGRLRSAVEGASAGTVSKQYVDNLNSRFRDQAAMMSNKETARRLGRWNILTLLVIVVVCVAAFVLLWILSS